MAEVEIVDLVSSDDEVGATSVGNSGLGNEADETGDGSELSDVEGNRMDEDQKEGDGSEEDDATSDIDMDPEGDEADDESGEEAEEEDNEKENDGDRILSSAAVAELIRFNTESSYPDILTRNQNSRGEGYSADVAEGTLPGGYETYADGFGNVTHNGRETNYGYFGDAYQFTVVSHSGTRQLLSLNVYDLFARARDISLAFVEKMTNFMMLLT